MAFNFITEGQAGRFGDIFNCGSQLPDEFAYLIGNICIPPHYISLVNGGNLFHGREDEDPITHLNMFYELAGSYRPPGIPHDAIKRALFSFSLKDQAREWYDSLSGHRVATFEELKIKFLMEYMPPAKIEKLRDAITSFKQQEGETFANTWKRFNDLLRKCPSHGLAPGRELTRFYQGLTDESKAMINASTAGDLDNKTYDEVRELFHKLAANQRNWYNSSSVSVKKAETFGDMVNAERMKALKSKWGKFQSS